MTLPTDLLTYQSTGVAANLMTLHPDRPMSMVMGLSTESSNNDNSSLISLPCLPVIGIHSAKERSLTLLTLPRTLLLLLVRIRCPKTPFATVVEGTW